MNTARLVHALLRKLLFATAVLVTTLPFARQAGAVEHDDEWVTAMIKMEMWTTAGVPSTDVYVDTVDGRVVLSGKVETIAAREASERVARTVEGVKDVRNLLQIVPGSKEKGVERSDKALEDDVKRAMASERMLKGTKVEVASVSKGLVLLTGDARTFSEHLVAIETARAVKGVASVATQIRSPRVLSDEEIEDGKDTRSGRNVFITTAVKLRLLADGDVPSRGINVDSRYGMVMLFGTVPTEKAKAAAARDARKVSGVDRVVNDLQVVPEADRKVVAAKDEVVKLSVQKALETRADLGKVDVKVSNAVVHLTGTVGSVPAKLRAAVLARASDGVGSVENDLKVKRKE